ncbi:MAG TPA: hypothetical protein VFP98_03095 [Candidatus Polarisedimenticolia bacterium]|nr:hypothetical protein [Candidatus Polarisedimenticolia bacterium]
MLSLFLTQTAVGCLLALLPIPPREAGRHFFRFAVALSGVLMLAGLSLPPPAPRGPSRSFLFAAAALLLIAAAGFFHLGRSAAGRLLMAVGLAFGMGGLIVDASRLAPSPPGLLHLLDALSSGLLTGSVLVAMVLGHYYLNVPGLSIRHLIRLTLIFLGAVTSRAVIVGASIVLHRDTLGPLASLLLDAGAGPLPESGPDPFLVVFLLLHVLFGILAAGIFALMAWRTARIASTQSATGILYVALIAVVIGEMASRYIVSLTRLPL